MSDPGAPPSQDQAPPAGECSSDTPVWLLALIAALVLALIGVVVLIVTHEGTAKSTRTYPGHWDSRIAPYVKIAEKQRGLVFLHPVTVRFLPAAEFEKDITADEDELDTEERVELGSSPGSCGRLV